MALYCFAYPGLFALLLHKSGPVTDRLRKRMKADDMAKEYMEKQAAKGTECTSH